MTIADPDHSILPFSLIVGQQELQTALQISYVDPGVGVLATGGRGTAKSTTIRSFSRMAYSSLPVTLPIGATEDRVLGGLSVEALLRGEHYRQPGLLEQASESEGRMLYIDEVNLLDDHLVNIILDAASTGVLEVQHDHVDQPSVPVKFALVGSMNPDEGGLRPQLLDRFGLVVTVKPDNDATYRRQVLENVLRFDEEFAKPTSPYLDEQRAMDERTARRLKEARDRRATVRVDWALHACARVAAEFELAGHRGEIMLCGPLGRLPLCRTAT
ncbi:AAA family ATPase [Catellatospora coxensis]